jgi:hypothetical protein
MLPIAKNKVRKPAAQRIEMPRERVIKPIPPPLLIRSNRILQTRHYQPQSAAPAKHASAFTKQLVKFIWIEVLDHVRRIDRIHRIRRKRQPAAHVKPQIELVARIRVDIHKSRKIFRPAAQVQMQRLSVSRTHSINTLPHPIIRQRGLRQAQKTQVFVTLVKQIFLASAENYTTQRFVRNGPKCEAGTPAR